MILLHRDIPLLIVDADLKFFHKACLDLLTRLIHSERDSSFLENNVHKTNPLTIRYAVDNFCI